MKNIRFLIISITSIWISSCASLKPPIIIKNESIEAFKFFYITPTVGLTSSSGATYGGQYYSSSKSVNPSDVITGILTKEGLIRLPELKRELNNQTLIVNYGESGKRNIAGGLGGYTIEVTIQFISAESHTLICSCTAEGIGATEADDIRKAITRCLTGLLTK
ncbi:hypothetical protein [Alkalitalea saponilacus]|uniref:DUF4136 domain-containing protein n=1 Tax=Alkalitalea saponilacus TaxID=889453 RepID=A0A1T5HT20_9BACT|nr:hypothetical protein [Alkalitalea saponilacus]ASB47740.1 hypothetical protein CDL62_00515 [Alkalitalea saponilacus]SKC23671.1 hypothetical protein SAMN03080601_02952 [Alkalitalea saponilacus]